jgi:hypothetical protein
MARMNWAPMMAGALSGKNARRQSERSCRPPPFDFARSTVSPEMRQHGANP